jgi:hypothetical protein
MAFGSKKGTQIYFYILSKVPANEPLQVPQERPAYRAFCISLKNLICQVPQ